MSGSTCERDEGKITKKGPKAHISRVYRRRISVKVGTFGYIADKSTVQSVTLVGEGFEFHEGPNLHVQIGKRRRPCDYKPRMRMR